MTGDSLNDCTAAFVKWYEKTYNTPCELGAYIPATMFHGWKAAWDHNLPTLDDVKGIVRPSELSSTEATPAQLPKSGVIGSDISDIDMLIEATKREINALCANGYDWNVPAARFIKILKEQANKLPKREWLPIEAAPKNKAEFSAMLMQEYGYSKKLSDLIAGDVAGYGAFDIQIEDQELA